MTKKISFPHMSYYYIPIKYIIKNITKCEVIIPEYNNDKTISLGSKYSPDGVCMPFKYNLGNYLNALNKGANILIQAGGGCRYGYYAELQAQILKEAGYNFTFINLIKDNHISIKKLYYEAKKINPRLPLITYFVYLLKGFMIIIYMDKLTKYYREHKALAKNPILFDNLLLKLKIAYSKEKQSSYYIIKTYYDFKKAFQKIPLKDSNSCLKILLIGELYTLMDSTASHKLEQTLIDNGSIVYRYTDLTYLLIKKKFMQNKILNISRKYLKYRLGADGAESIAHAITHCKQGIDGIIHIKSYSCVPEINAIPILEQINKDYNVPILYLSFDGENNIANIDTKIEAFYDMLNTKKNTQNRDINTAN